VGAMSPQEGPQRARTDTAPPTEVQAGGRGSLPLLQEVHPEGDQRARHPAARISPPAPRYPLKGVYAVVGEPYKGGIYAVADQEVAGEPRGAMTRSVILMAFLRNAIRSTTVRVRCIRFVALAMGLLAAATDALNHKSDFSR